MPAAWEIRCWPPLGYRAFLSHCAEDREKLVRPVQRALENQRLVPWFDQMDYPSASDPYHALRENLVRCRHIVYFITSALLRQGRGWCAVERSYAELMQRHFEYVSTDLWCLELPLIFLPPTEESLQQIQRTAWAPLLAKASWYGRRERRSLSRRDWSVSQIKKLIQQQENEATLLSDRLRNDQPLLQHLNGFDGLQDRVTSLFPITLAR